MVAVVGSRFQRLGIAALSLTAVELAAPGIAPTPAGADNSREIFATTTGEYYPGWYADNCLDATLLTSTSPITFSAASFDYVHGSDACPGSEGADMQTDWIKIEAFGFKDGMVCSESGFSKNSSPSSGWEVATASCPYDPSSLYDSESGGSWWTSNGSGGYQYSPVYYEVSAIETG